MNRSARQTGWNLFGGTARMFAAEALLVPVGVITAAFLSRRFGPEGYGLLTLAGVLVVWVEANVAAALSRPSIKLVGEAQDWQPVAMAILRLYLLTGLGLMLLLWVSAAPLAALLGDARLAGYLRLFALDLPLFCLAQAHRAVIIGTGRFRERALVTAARWVARLLLVVLFVQLSGALVGAIWGVVCSSLVELAVCRLYVRPRLFGRGAYPVRRLCGYALPLVASALCLSLYSRLDIILLKALGGTHAEAGLYAVAQNLSLLPSLFTFAFAPALLSTLSRALRDGDEVWARHLGRQALRVVLLLLPLGGMVAGAAPEIVTLIFGEPFAAAAPLLGPLMFAALALVMVSVMACIMTAEGSPALTFHVAWPLLLSAAAGHLLLIPRFGAAAAALVTAVVACAGALASVWIVRRCWRISLPIGTLWRSVFTSASAYALTILVPAPGLLLIPKLLGASAFIAAAFLVLGEFGADEIGAALRRHDAPELEVRSEAS